MITVLSPTASSVYYVGSGIVPISWDLGSLSSTLTGINIDYSLDSGLTWKNITSVTGTNTSVGLTSIVEDFIGDTYNEDNWVNRLATSSITGEGLNVGSGAYTGAVSYLTNSFIIRQVSSTASSMSISGSLWYSGAGSGTDITTLSIWQDSANNDVHIIATWLVGSNIRINGRINGVWIGPSAIYDGIDTGLNWSTKRWYQIEFDRTGQSITFYYKNALTSSWTSITSVTADFNSSLSAGVGSRKYNANSGRWGHVDDIGVTYSPDGAIANVGVSAMDWMPYVGTTSTNTALIRISDNGDSSVSAVNSLFSVLIPTTAINILNSSVIFNRNTPNGKIYKKNIQILK